MIRHKLNDGFSDEAIAIVRASAVSTKIIVLLTAGTSPAIEARQINLGADCVLRDPVNMEVILAYVAKYRGAQNSTAEVPSGHFAVFPIGGAVIDPTERTLRFQGKIARLTPKEVELGQLLATSRELVTYETMYDEIFGRKFYGDTSNLRVLLGKLDRSARTTGMEIRSCIEVIPKLGYRYIREKIAPPLSA